MNDKRTTDEIDALAQEIRRLDGENSLGAGALAEALQPFLTELQHRREAEAGAPVAFRWLDGEGHNAGWRYSDVDPRQDDREVEMSGAHSVGVCEPLYLAASPSSPASGVRVKAWSDNFVGLQHWRDEDNEDALTLTRNDIISLIEDYRSALGERP